MRQLLQREGADLIGIFIRGGEVVLLQLSAADPRERLDVFRSGAGGLVVRVEKSLGGCDVT